VADIQLKIVVLPTLVMPTIPHCKPILFCFYDWPANLILTIEKSELLIRKMERNQFSFENL
jgi:hypothetical protein